jgi:hypothetical protein
MAIQVSDHDMETAREALGNILKSANALHTSHERLHKAHSDAHATHKSCHGHCAKCSKAHESTRLNALDHRTRHQEHFKAVHDGASLLLKVLGGGPESITPASTGPESENPMAGKRAREQAPFDRLAAKVQGQSLRKEFVRVSPHVVNPHFTGGLFQGTDQRVGRR